MQINVSLFNSTFKSKKKDNVLQFHKQKKKLITLTAVRPPARFGFIKINNSYVKYFKEKFEKIVFNENFINISQI